jgi:hypothetical protein
VKTPVQELKRSLEDFFEMDDSNFLSRYDFFYQEIAPKIVLYRVKIGDTIPLSTFTRSGYVSSANLHIYGTFRFKNFENSPLVGSYNLIDMESFRELLGEMTAERRSEMQELEREMGTLGSTQPSAQAQAPVPLVVTEASDPCLNAAIMLTNDSDHDYDIDHTIDRINRLSKTMALGIQAISWKEASGNVGHLIFVFRAILYTFIVVVFVVSLFVIMNSLMMATIERTKEIGVMRAIGARRGFIMKLFLWESLVLVFIFGGLGIVLGVGILSVLKIVGIPASEEFFYFLFSGPRLYPMIKFQYVIEVFSLLLGVGLIAGLYPAYRATKVTPITAMSQEF